MLSMVGHLGVFVKVLYFVKAFISKVGLRNVLGTISEFSVRSHFLGEFLICHSFKKKFLEKVARYVTAVSYTPVIDPVTFSRKLFLKE